MDRSVIFGQVRIPNRCTFNSCQDRLARQQSCRYVRYTVASIYAHPKSAIFHVAFWYDGQQHRKSLRTRNRRKAQEDAKAVQEAVTALKNGRDREGLELIQQSVPVVDVIFPTAKTKKLIADLSHKPLHLRDLHDRWIEHQKNEGRAARTTDTIKHRLVDFLRMLGDDFRVDYLTRKDLDDYIMIRRKAGVAEYTIDRELKTLKGILNRAVELEWLSENPVKVWPKIKTEARKEFIPRERIEKIIATTDLSDEEIRDLGGRMLLSAEDIADLVSLAEERLSQLAVPLALVGVTGIRRTELITVKKSDLDMSKWTLTVSSDKGSRKKRQVRRTIEIHQSVVPMLEAHLKSLSKADRLLFPVFARISGKNRDSDSDINARCDRAHRLLDQLVADTRWMMLRGWHSLRHSAISIYLDQGYTFDQIAKWTGHVDPETQKLYTHWFDNNARERMDKLPFEFE